MTIRSNSPFIAMAAGCVLAGLSPNSASAEGFYVLHSGPDSWSVMDPRSVVNLSDSAVRQAWIVTVQRNLFDGAAGQSGYIRTLKAYDCAMRQVSLRSVLVYSRFGALVMNKQGESGPFAAAAGPEEGELRVVCDGAGGRSVVTASSIASLVTTVLAAWDSLDAAAPSPATRLQNSQPSPAQGALPPPSGARPGLSRR